MGDDTPDFDLPVKTCLQELVAFFVENSIAYTTIGGIAVSMIAEPRFTNDIDSVIWIRREDWDSFIEKAGNHGFTSRVQNPIEFAQLRRIFLLEHVKTGITVDISLGALPFEQVMIDHSAIVQAGDLKFRVPAPEDLIIMKILAGRPKDMVDVLSILKIKENLDLKRIRFWVNEFAATLEMPEINQRLEQALGNPK